MFGTTECRGTVSIAESILFGADGACVDLGVASLLGGVALFVGAVVALRFLGSAVLTLIFPKLRRKNGGAEKAIEQKSDDGLQRLPYESPIQSTRAWGSKAR